MQIFRAPAAQTHLSRPSSSYVHRAHVCHATPAADAKPSAFRPWLTRRSTGKEQTVDSVQTAGPQQPISESQVQQLDGQQQGKPIEASSHEEHQPTIEAGTGTESCAKKKVTISEEHKARISAKNTGKVPWNKGRKHSPETIAKIKERTKAAMSRPDVINNYKEGVGKHLEKLREEKKLKPPPPPKEKPVKPKAPPKPKAAKQASTDTAAGDGSATASTTKKRPSRSKKTTDSSEAKPNTDGVAADGSPPAEKPKRTRKPNSPEHRAAIAAAIRAKWQDPEYRKKTTAGIHQHIEEKTGKAVGESIWSKKKRGSGGSRGNSSSSSAAKKEQREKQAQLAHAQQLVTALLGLRKAIKVAEVKMAGIDVKSPALRNDPRTRAQAEQLLAQLQLVHQGAVEKRKSIEAKLPSGLTFDDKGVITITDHDLFFSTCQLPTEASSIQQSSSPASLPAQTDTNRANAGIQSLDSEVMRNPSSGVPESMREFQANGHANGHSYVNGANGHACVNGAHHHGVHTDPALRLAEPLPASELLPPLEVATVSTTTFQSHVELQLSTAITAQHHDGHDGLIGNPAQFPNQATQPAESDDVSDLAGSDLVPPGGVATSLQPVLSVSQPGRKASSPEPGDGLLEIGTTAIDSDGDVLIQSTRHRSPRSSGRMR